MVKTSTRTLQVHPYTYVYISRMVFWRFPTKSEHLFLICTMHFLYPFRLLLPYSS